MRFSMVLVFCIFAVTAHAQQSSFNSYSWISQNILAKKCAQCHGGLTYSYVKSNWVRPLPLMMSPLFGETYTKQMPKDGPSLSPGELSAIGNWIKSGALQN